ncbi:MAG TPA: hypothetical protein VMY35_07390 [Phycisphaerae bacterium]|nr:hypothetical protein [Phycisphaerae bacterium]
MSEIAVGDVARRVDYEILVRACRQYQEAKHRAGVAGPLRETAVARMRLLDRKAIDHVRERVVRLLKCCGEMVIMDGFLWDSREYDPETRRHLPVIRDWRVIT